MPARADISSSAATWSGSSNGEAKLTGSPGARHQQWLVTQRQVGKNNDLRLYAGLSFLRLSL